MCEYAGAQAAWKKIYQTVEVYACTQCERTDEPRDVERVQSSAMRRICLSALLLGALSVPALSVPTRADPLPITPAAMNTAPTAAPVRLATAQSALGGGFIQFLFGGAEPTASGPSADAPAPDAAAQNPSAQTAALASDPDAASAEAEEYGYPPVDPKFDRQEVTYETNEPPGTIVIDTPHHFLFLVEDGGKALRYGIGVGRPGFIWSGVKTITAKREWPDWRPPDAMLQRQPELPRFMAGGPQNPLGARAMYLGSTDYRIHGSNEPWTIGHNVSSGCIRLRNADVIDLYNRVKVGTKVVVM
jgi:lipoprotein-anchoring transpeptidase ErfK/SrfK